MDCGPAFGVLKLIFNMINMELKQGINLIIDRFIHQSIASYGAPSKDWYMPYYGTPILGPAFLYKVLVIFVGMDSYI